MINEPYTTKLGAGQGIVEETRILLRLWEPGMDIDSLYKEALHSGLFPAITARRLSNLVREGFAPRYLNHENKPAIYLKPLLPIWHSDEFTQLLFIYTCRLHAILKDYIKEVYWPKFEAGNSTISIEDAREFVKRANQSGMTSQNWSIKMEERVSSYLNGTCADFGLLSRDRRGIRDIFPFRIKDQVFIYLSYELHFSGSGDNAVINHKDWKIYGLSNLDVFAEFKRLALKDWFIVQSAGLAARISWKYDTMMEVVHALAN